MTNPHDQLTLPMNMGREHDRIHVPDPQDEPE